MSTINRPKCEHKDITTIRTSSESYHHCNNHFHKNLLYFRIHADFEADNEIDNSGVGDKRTKIFKQSPVPKGYHIESELEDVLQSSYYKSLLGYNNIDWFVDEVIKLEIKLTFYSKNNKKDIIMTEKDEEDSKIINICRFCEKNIESDKVRDHCHLTGNYKGPALGKCIVNVTQKQSNFVPFIFHIFPNYDCHMFFKMFVNKKNDKVKFDFIPKTKEEIISVTYGCMRLIDSYRSLSSCLDSIVS